MTKIPTKDWRNLPIDKWNTTTFTAYLTDKTTEIFGVEYQPTGGGSKSKRWMREKGMMKQAQSKYGNAVLLRFIDVCLKEYTPKADYPYVAFTFMYSYMDRNWPKAQSEIEAEKKAEARRERAEQSGSDEDLSDWL